MIRADYGKSLGLRDVDASAAPDLGEVVDWRNLVAPGRIRRSVAGRNSFQDLTGTADQQPAAFVRRITARVRDDRRQRFAVDSDVRQPGPR